MASSEPADGAVPPYAGFGSRALAAVIDTALALVAALPGVLVLLAGPTHRTECRVDGTSTPCTQPTSATFAGALALLLICLTGYTVWWARRAGQTQSVGQRVGAVRIVDVETGLPVGPVQAAGRQFAKVVSLIPLGLGFWWMTWDPRRQTWHDKLAGTVVVHHSPGPVAA